eukprot:TRINITY_DN529_c0_g2_i2.p1 TRINITY_DN529_c0_g2~~TRINITY_DN529_c0_g2_i2.p1  ORF type:complete len:518 (+),score=61.80 TRINITY_DN529_c0_g2_i2:768-2321(+)
MRRYKYVSCSPSLQLRPPSLSSYQDFPLFSFPSSYVHIVDAVTIIQSSMIMTGVLPQDEQPLVTVKDYRPYCHSSSSSDVPDSTDDEFDFEQEKPCPFADVPKICKFGKPYFTRYANGVWGEKPLVTTVESPFRLRCWSINGPQEFCDEKMEGEPFRTEEDVIVPMTGLSLISRQRGVLHPRRTPNVGVGKMSPLQKSFVKIIPPPRSEQSNRSMVAPSRCTSSQGVDVKDMLNTEGRMVEDPSGLSDTSSDSESELAFTYKPSLGSSNLMSIDFCLRSEEDSCSGESQCDPPSPEQSCELYAEHLQTESNVDSSLLSADALSNLAQPQAQVQSLTHQIEKLMSLANILQDQITGCNREKMHLQQQIQALRTTQCSSEESTSPRSSAAENSQEKSGRRPSSKCFAREEERLRMELLEEKQKNARVQLENEQLLVVILKLKCEMDLEHELHESFQKKAVSEQSGGRWQKLRQMVRSSSGFWDSKDGSKRTTFQCGWPFRRSKSRKQKQATSSRRHFSP